MTTAEHRNKRETLDRLTQLEPSPLISHPGRYRVTYTSPQQVGKWITQNNLDLWTTWYLVKTCVDLGRDVRVQDEATGQVFGTLLALLNLFYIPISGRGIQQDRKSDCKP